MAEELSLAEISAQVISEINTNFSQTEDAVNAKAELNGESTEKFKVADAVELTEAINKGQLNTAVSTINADIAELEATVATKADRTYVDSNLALKANTADVNVALAQKSDKSYVDANLALKSDKTYVDSNLALKANTSDVDAALALKADKTYVDTNLVLKANVADVQAALATKADLNGNAVQVFNVADATTPTQAVNKGQLDNAVININTEITNLEEEIQKAGSKTAFCMNSGNVNASGDSDILYALGIGTATELYPRPNLTANGTMGGSSFAVSCDGSYGADAGEAWRAVNGNSSDAYNSTKGVPKNYYLYFPEGIVLKSLQITNMVVPGYNTGITSGILKGSNDNTNWTDIVAFSNSLVGGGLTWTLDANSNTTNYKYYAINITGSSYYWVGSGLDGYYCWIQNIDIYYQATVSTAINLCFKVGSTYPKLILTYADKSQEELTSLQNITGLSVNGTYTIIKEKNQNPIAVLSTKLTQGKVFPTNAAEGSYHCLTSTDLQTFKYVSNAWIETQYVPIGIAIVQGGVITLVKTNQYNQNGYNINKQTLGIFSQSWTSDNYTITLGTGINIAHNLNLGTDAICIPQLICTTAVEGYSVGDIIQGPFTTYSSNYCNMASPILSANSLFQPVGSQYAFFVSNKAGTCYMAASNVTSCFKYRVKIIY